MEISAHFVLCVINEGLSLALVKGTVVPGGLIVKKKNK